MGGVEEETMMVPLTRTTKVCVMRPLGAVVATAPIVTFPVERKGVRGRYVREGAIVRGEGMVGG